MKNRELVKLVKSYRHGLVTAEELIAILKQKLYNNIHEKERTQN